MTRAHANILAEIIEDKRKRLALAKVECPLEVLRERAEAVRRVARRHALRETLSDRARLNIIAEIKRASPSKGDIRRGVAAEDLARAYERGGAAAISVLTEEDRFKGSLDDLRAVRAAVSVPVLRKDFIFDEYQVYEAAEAGADALLLIVAALDDETLTSLRRLAEDELGMDALVEVHTEDEMRRARASGARIVGVNNRDLHTFEVSLATSAELAKQKWAGTLFVSESGLNTKGDVKRLGALGFDGFLIGEKLMRADDPEAALKQLLSN